MLKLMRKFFSQMPRKPVGSPKFQKHLSWKAFRDEEEEFQGGV